MISELCVSLKKGYWNVLSLSDLKLFSSWKFKFVQEMAGYMDGTNNNESESEHQR